MIVRNLNGVKYFILPTWTIYVVTLIVEGTTRNASSIGTRQISARARLLSPSIPVSSAHSLSMKVVKNGVRYINTEWTEGVFWGTLLLSLYYTNYLFDLLPYYQIRSCSVQLISIDPCRPNVKYTIHSYTQTHAQWPRETVTFCVHINYVHGCKVNLF